MIERMVQGRIQADLDDLTLSARIREAALSLVAERGAAATSIRMVAKAAGVSPGAVTHHYRTKDDLLAAVHRSVEQRVHDLVATVPLTGSADVVSGRRREVYDRFLLDHPEVVAYMRRMFLDGGPEAAAWFRQLIEAVRGEVDALVRAGIARPFPDPDVGLVVYAVLGSVPLLLQPLLGPALGLDASDPSVRARFRDAVVALLTTPMFGASNGAEVPS